LRFSRQQRLNTPAAYRQVFSTSKSSRDAFFRVLGRPNGLDQCRLGMAVAKKNCRKAVSRNRLKRLIRESFRLNGELLNKGQGIDFVVLPMREAATICNRTLSESLNSHWRKIQDKCKPV
jgi:ribonuclease P protein component